MSIKFGFYFIKIYDLNAVANNVFKTSWFNTYVTVCEEYKFQAQIQIQIYLDQNLLANANMNIFGLTFLGEYKY